MKSETLGIINGASLTKKQHQYLGRLIGGKTFLEWVVRQVTDCVLLNSIIVLTPTGPEGDLIQRLTPNDVEVFSSDADNTLTFLLQACERFGFKSCLLVDADWPFIDPTLIDKVIQAATTKIQCDYATFQFMNEIFSNECPYIMFPEWYSSVALLQASLEIEDEIHTQFPGAFFLDHHDKYTVEMLPTPQGFYWKSPRHTVRNEEDWDNMIDLFDALHLDVLDYQKVTRLIGHHANTPNLC
jgi:spore coat polysaccharide biosynthesis protein SpsF (cytidylyltransferase family)